MMARPANTPAVWTPERIAALETMVAKRMSASHIAKAFGDVSRNAVIGICNRRGIRLTGIRPGGIPPRPARVPRPAPVVKLPKPRQPRRIVPLVAPAPENAVLLMDLERDKCRFPVGDATGARQLFCAAPKGDEGSYCPWHTLKVVDRSGRRDDRRPSAKFVMRGHY